MTEGSVLFIPKDLGAELNVRYFSAVYFSLANPVSGGRVRSSNNFSRFFLLLRCVFERIPEYKTQYLIHYTCRAEKTTATKFVKKHCQSKGNTYTQALPALMKSIHIIRIVVRKLESLTSTALASAASIEKIYS